MAATPTKDLAFDNFFSATLTGDITASSTDILMDNIPTAGQGFLVIEPDSASAREVIFYTSKTALKVVCPSAADGRGQDGTSAGAHSTGATVIMAPIAAFYEALQSGQSMADNSAATRHYTDASVTPPKWANPYKFSAYKSGAQTVNTGAAAKITFETEEFDTNSNFATSTYTVPVTGYYMIVAGVGTNAVASSTRRVVDIYVNGSARKRGVDFSVNAATGATQAVALLSLTASDTVEIYLTAVGANQAITVEQTTTYFQGFLVSIT